MGRGRATKQQRGQNSSRGKKKWWFRFPRRTIEPREELKYFNELSNMLEQSRDMFTRLQLHFTPNEGKTPKVWHLRFFN